MPLICSVSKALASSDNIILASKLHVTLTTLHCTNELSIVIAPTNHCNCSYKPLQFPLPKTPYGMSVMVSNYSVNPTSMLLLMNATLWKHMVKKLPLIIWNRQWSRTRLMKHILPNNLTIKQSIAYRQCSTHNKTKGAIWYSLGRTECWAAKTSGMIAQARQKHTTADKDSHHCIPQCPTCVCQERVL